MSKHRNKSILTEPITSVTEMYIEKALDDDSRVQYQTVIYPNHVSGSSRKFEVIRLDLRSGRFEIVGRELDLATARHVATRNVCQTAEDYRVGDYDDLDMADVGLPKDEPCCDNCGDYLEDGDCPNDCNGEGLCERCGEEPKTGPHLCDGCYGNSCDYCAEELTPGGHCENTDCSNCAGIEPPVPTWRRRLSALRRLAEAFLVVCKPVNTKIPCKYKLKN